LCRIAERADVIAGSVVRKQLKNEIRGLLLIYVTPPVFLCGMFAVVFTGRLAVTTVRDWVSPRGVWIEYYHSADFAERKAVRPLRALAAYYPSRPAVHVRAENFFARIDGWLKVPKTGQYGFATLSDDGIRLYVDGHLLIDNWRSQSWRQSGKHIEDVDLSEGFHKLRVDYFNGKESGRFRVEWCGGPIPPRTTIAARYLRKEKP